MLQVEVVHGGVTDQIIAALDHKYIRTDCIDAFAELAFVRKDVAGEVVATWTH